MELLKTKCWSWVDIWILKWCAFMFGIIAGAYLSDLVKQYLWLFVLAAVLLTIRPAVKYFGKSQ